MSPGYAPPRVCRAAAIGYVMLSGCIPFASMGIQGRDYRGCPGLGRRINARAVPRSEAEHLGFHRSEPRSHRMMPRTIPSILAVLVIGRALLMVSLIPVHSGAPPTLDPPAMRLFVQSTKLRSETWLCCYSADWCDTRPPDQLNQ